jgi:hypothetical protein
MAGSEKGKFKLRYSIHSIFQFGRERREHQDGPCRRRKESREAGEESVREGQVFSSMKKGGFPRFVLPLII